MAHGAALPLECSRREFDGRTFAGDRARDAAVESLWTPAEAPVIPGTLMRTTALKFCVLLALVTSSLPHQAAAQTTSPGADATSAAYAEEPMVIEHADSVLNMLADGTGWRQLTLVARLQSDATVKAFGVLTVPYASSSEHVEISYARVRHPDGTVNETQPSDAMDMPSPVTRAAPFYSDQKEVQLPIRNLRVGDTLEYKYRIVRTKAEVPGQFWGQEVFSDAAVVLSKTVELRVPADGYINIWSPGFKAVESSTDATVDTPAQHIYRWSYSQLKPTAGKDAEAAAAAKKKILWTADQELDLEQGRLPSIAWTTFKTWGDIGAWYRSLESDRVVPDDAVKAKATELTAGKTTDEAKAQALYSYVALSIRYIGVAFGIGRYQPHTAAEILSNQYGDCKDKHTLFAAMLAAAGIPSNAVLIGAGIRFNPDVPSPAAFNHVITRVTLSGKHVWLDTTAEVAPWGMLTLATRDKQALVVFAAADASAGTTAAPAAIVHTPTDPVVADAVSFDASGALDAGGVSTSRIVITFHGDGEIAARAAFRQLPPAQYDRAVQAFASAIGYTGTTTNPDVSRATDTTQPFKLSFDYKREKAGDWDHLRTIPQVMPVVLPRVTDIDPPVHAIQLGSPRTEDSTSSMKLPDGWTATLPGEVHVKCAYATYDMTYRLDGNTIYAERHIAILTKKVPVSDWQTYKAWVDKVNPGREPYIQLATAAPKPLEQHSIQEALNTGDPITRNMAVAAEDARNAHVAQGYVTQLAGSGTEMATRLAASRAAMKAETAAAATEEAAAAVETDASKATAAAAAGDQASVKKVRDKAKADYSDLLAADNQLAKAATELTAAAAGNAAYLSQNAGSLAINDLGAQDSSAAANLLSAATKGETAGYNAAAANEAIAIKDANTMAGLDAARAAAFKAVAKAEAAAQSAAKAAAAGENGAAAASAAAAAATGATADGAGNPFAGAVENGAAAVANAAAATISAQHAMENLKALQ